MATPVDQVLCYLRKQLQRAVSAEVCDAELLQRFTAAADDDAFTALVERHGPLVLGVCTRILQQRQDAEDAFQATFLVLARQGRCLRDPNSLAAWLHGIARRVALNMKRHAGKRHERERQAAVMPAAPAAEPLDLGLRELQLALDEELQRLPAKQRLPLLLCYLEGLSQQEAAQQLGWPRGTLKRRLERGREVLGQRLTRRGLTLGAALLAARSAEAALAVPLSKSLATATVRAAAAFARHGALLGAATPRAVALAEGMLRLMTLFRLQCWAVIVVLGLGLGGLSAAFYGYHIPGQQAEAALPAAAPMLADKQPNDATATTKRFETVAAQLEMFPTSDFAYGRAMQLSSLLPRQVTEHWRKTYAALDAGQAPVAALLALLKHRDPKVRTLALAAVFDRQDPHLLPNLAALLTDKEKTVPEIQIRRAIMVLDPHGMKLQPDDYQQQTVGDIARAFLARWLEPAFYQVKDFDAYWAAHKERAYCASWFVARFIYAAQSTTAFDAKRGTPLLRKLRQDIDALPVVEREWEFLAVASRRYGVSSEKPGRIFATEADVIAAGKRLGPRRLMDLIEGKPISTDPDLAAVAASKSRSNGRGYMLSLVLSHAGQLLRPEDAEAIHALGDKAGRRSPLFVVAAAELCPAKASGWLHDAMAQLNRAPQRSYQGYERADLAAALWRTVGLSELTYLADWFYGEQVDKNPHSTQTERFLKAIQGVRAPADRKLVARLVTDPRLERLDYQSLRALITVVNGWTKTPVVEPRALYPNWQRGTWEPQTETDLQVLASWRKTLRKSRSAWQPRD